MIACLILTNSRLNTWTTDREFRIQCGNMRWQEVSRPATFQRYSDTGADAVSADCERVPGNTRRARKRGVARADAKDPSNIRVRPRPGPEMLHAMINKGIPGVDLAIVSAPPPPPQVIRNLP